MKWLDATEPVEALVGCATGVTRGSEVRTDQEPKLVNQRIGVHISQKIS